MGYTVEKFRGRKKKKKNLTEFIHYIYTHTLYILAYFLVPFLVLQVQYPMFQRPLSCNT